MSKRRKRKRKQERKRTITTDTVWEKSTLGRLGPRAQSDDGTECFECHRCGSEFRYEGCIPHQPCKRPDCCTCSRTLCGEDRCAGCHRLATGRPCDDGSCPNCGSIYVEWLSYDIPWKDVYTAGEWATGERIWPGSRTVLQNNVGSD